MLIRPSLKCRHPVRHHRPLARIQVLTVEVERDHGGRWLVVGKLEGRLAAADNQRLATDNTITRLGSGPGRVSGVGVYPVCQATTACEEGVWPVRFTVEDGRRFILFTPDSRPDWQPALGRRSRAPDAAVLVGDNARVGHARERRSRPCSVATADRSTQAGTAAGPSKSMSWFVTSGPTE